LRLYLRPELQQPPVQRLRDRSRAGSSLSQPLFGWQVLHVPLDAVELPDELDGSACQRALVGQVQLHEPASRMSHAPHLGDAAINEHAL
jgi:hypothetical protein